MVLRSEDGYCKIKELMEGPAKKSGKVKPNDKIIAVAQGTNVQSGQVGFEPDELAYIANHYVFLDHDQTFSTSAGNANERSSTSRAPRANAMIIWYRP